MKTELKVKYLQHLNEKRREGGFTLIELLVVVIIIGILAAVALPSLLSQANKAKQVEARNNVGAMNRAQQAYNLEKPGFAATMVDLGIGIQTQTTNYKYEINGGATDATNVNNQGTSLDTKLKSYVGYTWTTEVEQDGVKETVTRAIVCEAKQAGLDAITGNNNGEEGDCDPNVQLGT